MAVLRNLMVAAAILAVLLFSGERKEKLGPRDPIAADGSLTAGRALTIVEQHPPQEQPRSILDEPSKFEPSFSGSSVDLDRGAVLDFVELPGPAICEPDRHAQLIRAIQKYYGTKNYLYAEFHYRGPRASRFIDEALATAQDRKIDAFVQQLLDQGYLRAYEIWPRDRSFLLDVLAQEIGINACARS
jgi:hypothetical protein